MFYLAPQRPDRTSVTMSPSDRIFPSSEVSRHGCRWHRSYTAVGILQLDIDTRLDEGRPFNIFVFISPIRNQRHFEEGRGTRRKEVVTGNHNNTLEVMLGAQKPSATHSRPSKQVYCSSLAHQRPDRMSISADKRARSRFGVGLSLRNMK